MKRLMIRCALIMLILVCVCSQNAVAQSADAMTDTTALTETSAPQTTVTVVQDTDDSAALAESLVLNERLLGLYDTWTAVVSIVLILVTVIGIAVPLYGNNQVDKKLQKAVDKIKSDNEVTMQKHLLINNAQMLAASKEYWTSNEILKELIKDDPDSVYLHLLIGRNVFYQYIVDKTSDEWYDDQLAEIEEAIGHYLFVADRAENDEGYYRLGTVFPSSIIHELCMLTSVLVTQSIEAGRSHYHKLTVSVINAIEKVLGIRDFDDVANEDQTNVYIMNYIALQHQLAKSYAHFGNIKAKEQYQRVLKLYSISHDLDYTEEIDDCRKALSELE